jgi:hypothetical protein
MVSRPDLAILLSGFHLEVKFLVQGQEIGLFRFAHLSTSTTFSGLPNSRTLKWKKKVTPLLVPRFSSAL